MVLARRKLTKFTPYIAESRGFRIACDMDQPLDGESKAARNTKRDGAGKPRWSPHEGWQVTACRDTDRSIHVTRMGNTGQHPRRGETWVWRTVTKKNHTKQMRRRPVRTRLSSTPFSTEAPHIREAPLLPLRRGSARPERPVGIARASHASGDSGQQNSVFGARNLSAEANDSLGPHWGHPITFSQIRITYPSCT